jgi:hypothetical protein
VVARQVWVDGNLERLGPLLDETAAILAKGYERGDLTFKFCDGIVYGPSAAFTELPLTQMPPLFYDGVPSV